MILSGSYRSIERVHIVAKNIGGGRRGAIRGRTQFRLPSGHYAKRDRATGEILSVKADRAPYKGVVIEKPPISPAERAPERMSLPALNRPVWRARSRHLPEQHPVAWQERASLRSS
jgi:hypothetical protein